jgi:hypothetical protein
MDRRKGYVLLLINAGVRNPVSGVNSEFLCFNCNFFFAPLRRMGPRCSSAETEVVTGATLLHHQFTVLLERTPFFFNQHFFYFVRQFEKNITITDDPGPC